MLAKYKNEEMFLQSWSPANQAYCHNNLEKSNDVPTLNEVRLCFGETFVTKFVCNMIANLLIFRGDTDKMNEAEILMCASLLVNNHQLCVLNLAFFLNFFFEMKCGRFKIFGDISSGKIMECYQEYKSWAIEKQFGIYEREQQRKRDEEWQEHLRQFRVAQEKIKRGELPAPKPIEYEKIGKNF